MFTITYSKTHEPLIHQYAHGYIQHYLYERDKLSLCAFLAHQSHCVAYIFLLCCTNKKSFLESI